MLLRRVLTPRGVAITVAAAVAVAALLWLGQWQWQRSRPGILVATLPTVDVVSVLVGSDRLLTRDQGRLVSVSGTWRADRQLLVADRLRPDGSQAVGRWVVTAVQLDGEDRLLPVVRGWIAADADVSAVPQVSGRATVTGWVQASEPLDVPVEVVQPAGVVALLAAADLVNRWPDNVADGFVIANVGLGTGLVALPGPVEAARAERDWRNVAYAAQWWVFGAFTVVLWWRALADADAETDADNDNGGVQPTTGPDDRRARA